MRYRWLRFAQTRTGRRLARLPWIRDFLSRRVWAELLSNEELRAALERRPR